MRARHFLARLSRETSALIQKLIHDVLETMFPQLRGREAFLALPEPPANERECSAQPSYPACTGRNFPPELPRHPFGLRNREGQPDTNPRLATGDWIVFLRDDTLCNHKTLAASSPER
jgi:hypothetical protein